MQLEARRLPHRRIHDEAGFEDGAATAPRLRLEIKFGWLSENIIVISLFFEMSCIVRINPEPYLKEEKK